MNMPKCLSRVLVCGALATCSFAAPAAHAAPPQTEVVGLSIIKPAQAEPSPTSFGNSAVMGRSVGIEVHVRIHDPQSFFIGVKDQAEDSKTPLVLKTADDKVLEQGSFGSSLAFAASISEDGHTVTIPITASQLPPKGATSIKIAGTVSLTVGSDSKTQSTKFAVEPKTKLKLGNREVELSDIQQDPFGEEGLMLTFETNSPLDSIQNIKFLDGPTEIESSYTGKSSGGFGSDQTYSVSYSLKAKPKTVTANVTYFASTKQLDVPLNLAFGLSLESK